MQKILGIEFGSTRIKSVLIDEKGKVLAKGEYEWENRLVGGLWSYNLDEAITGMQASYKNLIANYGMPLCELDAIGISGMMHGYLALDKNGKLLAPFRTWRNTNTKKAAETLSKLFEFNVPMRWSVSQYYQSFLDRLPHIKNVAFLTTLAGYVHYRLTGEKVIGANDASGMFPLYEKDYDGKMMRKFYELTGIDFKKFLPKVLFAGEFAGKLTEEGARLIDPTGTLKSGVVLCAPEGDMGTGMVATNSVAQRTANVSLGTSANLAVVLEKPLKKYYEQIDVVATPDGYPAALVHSNNGTTEINEWANLFCEVANLCGAKIDKNQLFTKLFMESANSDSEVGGITAYNFAAGEVQAETLKGAPLIVRESGEKLSLANFMKAQLYAAIAPLALGVGRLKAEGVVIDEITAHGGFYKTEFIGQSTTSAMLGAPTTVMDNAGEGGAWGIALLAGYLLDNEKSLPEYLNGIFADSKKKRIMADEKEIIRCKKFFENYKRNLPVEQLASEKKIET